MLSILISNAALLGLQLLQLIVVAQLLGEVEVGRFGYALALTSPVQAFWMANLRPLLQTSTVHDDDLTSIIQSRIVQTFAFLATSLVIGAVTFQSGWALLVSMSLSKCIDMLLEIRLAILARDMRYGDMARAQSLRAVIAAVGFTGAVLLFHSIEAGFIAVSAGLLPLVAVDLRRLRPGRSNYLKAFRERFASDSARGLVSVGELLLAMLPRYVLMAQAGPAAVGGFTVVYYIITAFNVIFQAISQYFVRMQETVGRGWKTGLALIVALSSMVVCAAWFVGPEMIQFVFHIDVRREDLTLIVLSGAVAYVYVYLYSMNIGRIQPWHHLASYLPTLSISLGVLSLSFEYGMHAFNASVVLSRMLQLAALILLVVVSHAAQPSKSY